jgi:hypothetical protein
LDSTEAGFTVLLAGVCGAAIGYVIPHEYRKAVFTSITPESRLRLQELRRQIQESRRPDQEDWFGIPHPELGGITPWEASRYNSLTWELDRLVRELGASPDKVWSTQFDWSSINTPIVNTSEEGQRRRVAKLAKAHSSPSSRLRLMRTRFMQKT